MDHFSRGGKKENVRHSEGFQSCVFACATQNKCGTQLDRMEKGEQTGEQMGNEK